MFKIGAAMLKSCIRIAIPICVAIGLVAGKELVKMWTDEAVRQAARQATIETVLSEIIRETGVEAARDAARKRADETNKHRDDTATQQFR